MTAFFAFLIETRASCVYHVTETPFRSPPTAFSLTLWFSPSARSARPHSGLHLEPLTLEISPQIGEQLELLRTTQVGNHALEDRADRDVLDLRRVSLLPLNHLIVLTLISDE